MKLRVIRRDTCTGRYMIRCDCGALTTSESLASVVECPNCKAREDGGELLRVFVGGSKVMAPTPHAEREAG